MRLRTRVLSLVLAVTAAIGLGHRPAMAQSCTGGWTPGYGLAGVSGPVYTVVEMPSGEIIAGGNFTAAGKANARGIAIFSPATGEWSAMGVGLEGVPRAAALTPDGHLVVASVRFSPSYGFNVGYVSMWNGAAWQQLGPDFDHPIYALAALPNGDVVAGGDFHFPANYIARWDSASQTWGAMPAAGAPYTPVYALKESGGDLLVGWFTIQGRVSRFSGGAWSQIGGFSNGKVNGLAVTPSGDIVAVGEFTNFDGAANRVARWNGSAWTSMSVGTDYAVYSVTALPNNDVVIGGEFALAGGVDARRLARWNGSAWSSVVPAGSPPLVGSIQALTTTASGDVIAAGGFNWVGNTGVSNVARLRAATGLWEPVGKGWNGGVNALLKLASGEVVVAGTFTIAGENSVFGIGRWSPVTGQLTQMGSLGSFAAIPYSLCQLANGDIYACGSMSTDTGGIGNGLVRWNGSAWVSIGAGAGGSLGTVFTSLRMSNGDMVIGGFFTSVNGVSTPLIARWNGSSWSSIGGGLSGSGGMGVYSLAELPNGDLVAGGRFTTAGGSVATANIARWNGSAWSSMGLGLAPHIVTALAVLPNGDLVAGGGFTSAGGAPASHLARWNGSTWSEFGGGVTNTGTVVVNALSVLPDGSVVVGGSFSRVGGAGVAGAGMEIHNLARWDGAAWHPYGDGIDGGAVSAIAQIDGGLLVGGGFTIVDASGARSLARWNEGMQRCGLADLGAQGGAASACGDGILDNNDFVVFIDAFFAHDPGADHGHQGGEAGADGQWDNNDFVVFINEFFAGC